ncbi:MAG: polyprenyl synthetase family protein [Pseudomonadota bacterium]|nr:polyprenyl synthetase family protein [Pseudomonadota bacterium]
MSRPEFEGWMHAHSARIERWLAERLPGVDAIPGRLHEAMRYAALGGGKRMRPLLAYAAGAVTGAGSDALDVVAGAVELIHAYSLVHDDLPCMDDDVLRRGRPTCHVEFGEATALLAGDALQSVAFELLARQRVCADPQQQLELLALLAEASGANGMAGGQAFDLASVQAELSLPELESMHQRKTGALIRAAVLMGAACGSGHDAPTRAALDHFAKAAGLAFQVIDDVLDSEADTATLGKTAGKDAADGKPTYVSLLGLREARAMAAELHGRAVAALAPLGERAQALRDLASFIVERRH